MAERRRRSPEVSRRRVDPRRSEYYDEPRSRAGMRSGAESIYSSSSSSSSFEIIDISHSFPANRSGIATFFTAPSERRLRRRRSSRLFRQSNSSSESVGDLAYGHGYLRRPKRKVRSRKGKEIDRERYTERERDRERYTERERYSERHSDRERQSDKERHSDKERQKSGIGRVSTEAGILAVGAGLAKLARDQNKHDLKNAAKNGKQVYAAKEFGRRDDEPARGLVPSKVSHGSDTVDEDGWESASDAESESSVDSKLAFGAESQGGWNIFGRKKYTPQSRKNSIVDPRLFGPENSLHGVVTQPVGFGEVYWHSTSDFGQHPFAVPPTNAESFTSGSQSQQSMQNVYPIATEDSSRYDAVRSSVVSDPEPYKSSRPGPMIIQQPQPITPVSQSVYEPIYESRSEKENGNGILKKNPTSSSGRGKSLAEAALFGVAGAAVGAAIASDRRDDRKERRRDDERDEDRTPKRRDSEKKETKDDRKRDKKDSPDRDERKDKRREKDRSKDSPEDRKDKKKEKRRDDAREETRDERRERRREERRSERGDDRYDDRYDDRKSERSDGRNESRRSNSDGIVSTANVDPFQFQVPNDAFATPNNEPVSSHDRVQSVPTVVTIEREPDFTRKRSSSIKENPVSSRSEVDRRDVRGVPITSRSEPARYNSSEVLDKDRQRDFRDSRDRPSQESESIYEEAKKSTAPIGIAAIGAAIAAEGYRESRSEKRRDERRNERRGEYDDYDDTPYERESKRDSKDHEEYDRKSRDRDSREYDERDRKSRKTEPAKQSRREPERDPIQEEADRAYREIVMARKIASQVVRSRTPSPNRSVVDKYDTNEEQEVIQIVTPPGMEDHKKKGMYDAPNADFQLDHVLEDPREIRRFSLPPSRKDRSNSITSFLKKDPEASQPRPLLNLVRPTPSPSPMPEKQVARSEPARKSKPQVEQTSAAASDVVIGPRGNVIPSSSMSNVSKGVTWGENETKHFEVESPSEHRDEYVSSPEIRAHDAPVNENKSITRENPAELSKSRSGWGTIAAGIIGAGAGAAATKSSDVSKSSKTSKTTDRERKDEAPYEYRGIVVEPESPPSTQRQRSPPATGLKPSTSQTSQASRIPGAFDDDLDFTATVAAGLQDTGFDPNIVINDPTFRRRDSPPGSNEPGYRAPYAETVSDYGSVMREPASIKNGERFDFDEEATSPRDWSNVSPDDDNASSKLSKREQKKREKAKRQSGDFTPVDEIPSIKGLVEEPESYPEKKLSKKDQKKRDKETRRQSYQAENIVPVEDYPVAVEIVEEPESYTEDSKKKSKKSKKGTSTYDDDAEDASRDSRKVIVPVDAFDDLRNGEDDWSETKKSKRKSKRDSERYDSPARSVPTDSSSPPLERTSSLSEKAKRRSGSYEPEPTEISLPPSTPSENSRDGDFEEPRKSRKSSVRDSADRGDSRSVVSSGTSRHDDGESRKSKRKSKSRDDFDDTRSVTSAPAGDDFDDKKSKKKDKKNSGGFFSLFGSKSEVGARDDSPKRSKDDFDDVKKKSKKSSKRNSMPDASSLYGDLGAQSVGDLSQLGSNGYSNGNGTHRYDDDDRDQQTRDDSKRKSRIRSDSVSSKKESFLAKAGTLGAGVGIAGAAVAIAAQHHQQSNADNAHKSKNTAERSRSRSSRQSKQDEEIIDPEITQRQFRPSIDPQYGDLLPLPPSDPVSPNVEPVEDMPDLPDSRPDTPEADRLAREKALATVRKSFHDSLPMKSPSQSAVPLKFIMGNRSTTSSPGAVRSSPLQSPTAPAHDALQYQQVRPRSWESTKEFKPLYLVESNRRNSKVQQPEFEDPLPALPPSQRTSRSSSQIDSSDDAVFEDAEQYQDAQAGIVEPLSIDTSLAKPSAELLDSQQSTPKASVFQYLDADQTEELPEHKPATIPDRYSLPTYTAADVVAGTALVSSIGYFASSPRQKPTEQTFLDELPSQSEVQPSPIDPMTKDRSSYLLQSSPLSRKTEDDNLTGRGEEDSPTDRQNPDFARNSLQSIEERDGNEDFEQPTDLQPRIDHERERALESLSGTSRDQKGLVETSELPAIQAHDSYASNTEKESEPVEEYALTKSRDKKKNKKKSKDLSSSSFQDEVVLPETTQNVSEEPPAPAKVEEWSLPKSKKDKKKSRLSRSSTQDDFSSESSREVVDEPSAPAEAETQESYVSKSKKEKKKSKLSRSLTQDDIPSERPNRKSIEEPSTTIDKESAEELPVPISQKDKKGKSVMPREADEESQSPTADKLLGSTEISDSRDDPVLDDFVAVDTKSKKKDRKNRKSLTTNEDSLHVVPANEPAQDLSRNILEAAVPVGLGIAGFEQLESADSAPPFTSQEPHQQIPVAISSNEAVDLNKEDQDQLSASALDTGNEDSHPKITPDVVSGESHDPTQDPPAEGFATYSSKKSKKKKARSIPAWEPEEEKEAPSSVQEAEAAETFVTSRARKDKKGKKSQSWTPEEVVPAEQPESLEPPPTSAESREITDSKSDEQQVNDPDHLAPATSGDTANEDFTGPSSTDHFPSSVTSQHSTGPLTSNETKEHEHIQPAAAVIPALAAGAAFLVADYHEQKSQDNAATEGSIPQDLESESSQSKEPRNEIDGSPSLPDGLKAGYDNEQLSLARRLQEEFSSSSSKSKNKKKRQSLPATPDRDVSRSRDLNEASEEHHRARSLSMRPLPGIERSVDRPMSEDRKNIYSEDQLELARKLKADFEGGNKKSKKDKKKRQGLSRNSTQDDSVFDQSVDESQAVEPEAIEDASTQDPSQSTRDGFEAGYQEDQLSLARQLQAEFGSGSKKSKKDKKRRSTSQTPIQEPESQSDYFGDTSYLPTEEAARDAESGATPNSSVLNRDSAPDGLAAGYKEDQLDLARKLKEEFNSGSRKPKKDKKNRQSLLRNTTEDDLSSGTTPQDEDEQGSQRVDPQILDTSQPLPTEAAPTELEDEFAIPSKKSKKDKKGKKRESIAPVTADETPSNTQLRNFEGTSHPELQEENVAPLEEDNAPAADPEDEFAFTTKKTKKDKKGKKRQSTIDEQTDNSPVDATSKLSRGPSDTEVVEESSAPALIEPADEVVTLAKKSKKDKKGKKRESVADTADNLPLQFASRTSEDPSNSQEQSEINEATSFIPAATEPTTEAGSSEPLTAVLDEEFDLVKKKSKKDKKGKKRDSVLRSTTDDISSSDNFGNAVEALHGAHAVSSEGAQASEETVMEPFDDDWSTTVAKPTKHEEISQSPSQEESENQPITAVDPEHAQISGEQQAADVGAAGNMNKPFDDVEVSAQKSKTDEKRQSLSPSSSAVGDKKVEESTVPQEPALQHEPVNQVFVEDAVDPAPKISDGQDDESAFTTKLSKKDKKKRQSTQTSSVTDITSKNRDTSIHQDPPVTDHSAQPSELAFETPRQDQANDETIAKEEPLGQNLETPAEEKPEAQFENFAFNTKKSKKDKKKRKDSSVPDSSEPSGISTPIDSMQEAPARVSEPSLPSTSLREPADASEDKPVQEIGESAAAAALVGQGLGDAVDELGSFSTKPSKRDKKNRKSNITTPSEEPPSKVETTTPKDSVDLGDTKSDPEDVTQPADEEWNYSKGKKSKKDKKNRKSGVSTPVEDISPQAEAHSSHGTMESEAPQEAIVEQTQDPAENDWAPIAPKKSKKDKRKSKSGLSTPLEETLPEAIAGHDDAVTKDQEPESMPEPATWKKSADEPVLPSDETALEPESSQKEFHTISEDQVREDLDFFTTKKSKKEKRKKSGLSTPLETQPELQSVSLNEISEEPIPSLGEETANPDFGLPKEVNKVAENKPESDEPVREDWNSSSGKKSKKDKGNNNSAWSTPLEALVEPEASSTQPDNAQAAKPKSQLEELLAGGAFTTKKAQAEQSQTKTETAPEENFSAQQEDLSREMTPPELQTDWDTVSSEKSKEGKKGKSGMSTPGESETQPELASQVVQSTEESVPLVEEKDEEWISSTKQSKKDKKRKSELSTPIETSTTENAENEHFDRASMPTEELQPDLSAQRDLFDTEQPQNESLVTKDKLVIAQVETAPRDGGEDDNYATKESKKDKKKRNSTLPTPVEEITPDAESTQVKPTEFGTPQLPPVSNEPEKEADQVTPDASLEFVTQRSKKGKKKRKSGLSTPVEEALPPVDAVESSRELGSDKPTTEGPPNQREPLEGTETKPEILQITEAADDGVEYTSKKSKKDKKGKKASRLDSDSAVPTESVPQAVKDTSDTVQDRFTQSPVSFENESLPGQNDIVLFRNASIQDAESGPGNIESEDFPPNLRRNPSKKDKRKRQATVANINEQSRASQGLLTWADEVEEAEVERDVPVIQDIAKDETLSHIASTMEAAPVDDFARPTKKGKKGKKRFSDFKGGSSVDESLRSPIGSSSKSEGDTQQNDNSNMAAIGVALAGAAILTTQLGGVEKEASKKSVDEKQKSENEEGKAPTPAKKLSKKEKRKQSIDRRAPSDDPFDDPVLWEGAEPRAFEEPTEDNDAGSDGFWSQNNQESDLTAQASLPDNSNEGPVDLFAPTRTEQSQEPRLHDDLGKDTEESQVSEGIKAHADSSFIELPKVLIEEPRAAESYESFEQQPAELPEESPIDKDLSSQDDQFRPRSSLRYSQQGASNLPIVREESPAQLESEHIKPPLYPQGADDANRDSAFVTDSPIPGQRPFEDERIRDSGVHLREASPLDRTSAPASTSDDAIARLSWPTVDESTETVNLRRPHRPIHTPTAHRSDEEKFLLAGHQSPAPHTEEKDAAQSYASAEDRHHDARGSPSESHAGESHTDLHRTRTIRRSPVHVEESHTDLHRTHTIRPSPLSEQERPRHRVHRSHEPENKNQGLPSLSPEEDSKLPRHRVHRPHTPEGGHSDVKRDEGRDNSSLRHQEEHHSDLHRTATIHRTQKPDSLVRQRVQRIESPDLPRAQTGKEDKYGELNNTRRPKADNSRDPGDSSVGAAAAIAGATAGFAASHHASREGRSSSAQSQRSTNSNINRLRTPDPKIIRPESVGSNRSTPPLRRSDQKSGDLRSLSQRSNLDLAKEAELAAITTAGVGEASTTTAPPANPQANEGRVRAKEMADVYDGFGEGRMGSPRSPTRPHSMRRRQSMQVLDLEQRLEQLVAENRALADAKAQADRILQTTQHASSTLVDRDAELDSLKRTLAWLQNEVTRLTEVNDGLTSANITLGNQHNDRYNSLESQHTLATRELQEVRDSHNNLSQGMEGIVRNEVRNAVEDKDREIADLRAQLEAAQDQIREMQRQILESKAGDSEFLTVRDEDYFDNACQQLCQHVQQWVLRFSKFSDMRACRLTSEINNDKIIDRLDNAILDGSDVDEYLADRVKRRDVFMSMTMTMVWEFVFTRYLFGMDREQRQKLKSLEKLLSEVGPASAVHQWRATTLTLLSKREAFVQQREQDTLAVVNAVLETLTEILPPPSQLEQQIQEQLTRVMKAAVDLSIEMRTQRAEYMMLPPLQPEYDANGDLASKVSFNAALMNERSGDTVSNEELEDQKAVVRIVLFPLVVKKGDDSGEGDEEIVVCPAQVLVAKPKKQVRIFSNGSQPNSSRMSLQSSMPADYGEEGGVI